MKGTNKMRHTEFLQNYTASQFRVALSGKETPHIRISEEMRTKEWWITMFEQAIEDLNAGYYINGKAAKNIPSYWEEQIRKVKEFEPTY